MKNLKGMLAIVSILTLMISCGGDEPIESNNDLTGEWTAIAFSADISSQIGSGATTTATRTIVVGSNFDYDLVFGGSDWSTSGSYDTELSAEATGINIPATNTSVTGVEGSGTYTTEDDIITIQGSMFEYDMSRMGMTSINNDAQTISYSINSDGELTFSQDETTVTSMNGISFTTSMKSNSVWVRK